MIEANPVIRIELSKDRNICRISDLSYVGKNVVGKRYYQLP